MSRRDLLASAAAVPLASVLGSGERGVPAAATTFVLVHGAWHGGWCWKKVVPLLQAQGHVVVTPTLTGLGERAHLLSADVSLATHVDDVVGVVETDDLRDVILVGHSYGGMVTTAVAERIPSRVARLMYLDAFLPDAGKALRDYAPVPPVREDGWRVPPPGTPASWGVTDPVDVAWMQPRIGDQPIKTFTQAVQRAAPNIPVSRQTFVQCTNAPFFAAAAVRAKQRGFVTHQLLSAGHDAMITQPSSLASILLGLT